MHNAAPTVITVKPQGKYNAKLYVAGKLVGTASACEGCWVVLEKDENSVYAEVFSGAFPANNAEDLAYAIGECCDGYEGLYVGPRILSREQREALELFAERHGRTWKQALNDAWMNGSDANHPLGHALRQVRNQFGPSWLVKFKF